MILFNSGKIEIDVECWWSWKTWLIGIDLSHHKEYNGYQYGIQVYVLCLGIYLELWRWDVKSKNPT